jgi:hypothetical protein
MSDHRARGRKGRGKGKAGRKARLFRKALRFLASGDNHGGFWTMLSSVYSQQLSHPAREREAIRFAK